jgi:hypothetical protein
MATKSLWERDILSFCHRKKLPTIIKYAGQGKDVYLCGTFNGWQKLRMSRSHKDFVAMIELGVGDHEYKFLVDGQWITDSGAPTVENNSGFKNNIIHVQKEDFDAFEAFFVAMAATTGRKPTECAQVSGIGTLYLSHSVGFLPVVAAMATKKASKASKSSF